MKIDIGVGGKILGTKIVSQNGQVSGLSEYAGQEVLIVLPGTSTEIGVGSEDFLVELQRVVTEHMRLAFKQYKSLKQTYGTPTEASKAFLKNITPKTMHSFIDQVDTWIKDQANQAEKQIEKTFESPPKTTRVKVVTEEKEEKEK